ncbi:putative ubiquitin fusion degradation protein 1-like [Apostichopus japonicus]|uniref:Putative ubiquitin fusion degradation protein 1-like n=1 Tax=Stichopus japonicus TaxID=307972 RepID=A0A2G8JLL5_STIJA|nr:putative ubiquitin fusion degradation protein 1-like [Apostichopus japonicus]
MSFANFGYNMFRGPFPQRFKTQYRCYSVSMLSVPRADLESGGKIIMPPSALDTLDDAEFTSGGSLENVLRSFACLTNGDLIAIKYNKKVEFAPPVGYVEPQKPKVNHHDQEDMQVDGQDHAKEFVEQNTFMAFTGEGRRLDGKTKNTKSEPVPLEPLIYKRGVPNYDYKRGTLTFIRSVKPSTTNTAEETEEVLFKPFTGEGQVLKKKRTKKP